MTDRLDFMDSAARAFAWIGSVAVATGTGLAWRDPQVLSDDLYSGTAGVLVACAEAAAAGFDPGRVAAGARTRLLYLARPAADVTALSGDGLFSGWAGVAMALQTWSDATGDAPAADAAAEVRWQLADRILHTLADPAPYLDVISGDAGLLLALLPGSTPAGADLDPGSGPVRPAAHLLADRLVAAAEPGPAGPQWRMKAGRPALMPGFSHGTAGVAYALAIAGRALGRPDLLATATAGARTLLAIGDHPAGWAVPLAIPGRPGRPLVSYGWCHGPTGTIRLFVLLNDLDPQPVWQHAIEACLQALRDSRLPARLYPGYWDNLARCCGTAGVGQLLLDRYQATADPAFLAWSDTLATDVTTRALSDSVGLTWSNTEHTAAPPGLPPEPGLMQGAAGIASWLARHHALSTRRDLSPRPIGPFPSWL